MDVLRSAVGGGALCLAMAAVGACDRPAVTPSSDTTGTDAAAPIAPIAPAAHVALDGEGVRIVLGETGSTRLLAFGSPAAQAVSIVSKIAGEPVARATNLDCGAGAMEFVSFRDGTMLNVQEGRLVGWTVRPGSASGPTTMSGIGLGATREQLESAYSAAVRQSTIGTEFSAGGIGGVLESAAPTARITDIWAGLNCIAR